MRVMSFKWIWAFAVSAVLGTTGCMSTDHEVKELDLSKLEPNEGIFAARIMTSVEPADGAGGVSQARDADFDYSIEYSTTTSRFNMNLPFSGILFTTHTVDVNAEDRVALVVHKLEAGDYYWNTVNGPSGELRPFAGKFSVVAGALTYIGDLELKFTEEENLFGGKVYHNATVSVGMDPDAIRRALTAKFGTVPTMRIDPMEFESVSF